MKHVISPEENDYKNLDFRFQNIIHEYNCLSPFVKKVFRVVRIEKLQTNERRSKMVKNGLANTRMMTFRRIIDHRANIVMLKSLWPAGHCLLTDSFTRVCLQSPFLLERTASYCICPFPTI